MAIKWSEDLSLGIKEIDDQHKELFRQMDIFINAINAGKGKDEVGEIIDFLENYVIEHFGMEEKKMLSLNYHNYPAHKSLHTTFMTSLWNIKQSYEKSGGTSMNVVLLNTQLNGWLKNHIANVDQDLGVFLKSL